MRFHQFLVVLVIWSIQARALFAEDIRLKNGTLLKSASVLRQEGGLAVVVHSGGVVRVPSEQLPETVRKQMQAPDPEAVIVTGKAVPFVERFEPAPDDALTKRFAEDIAKRDLAKKAKAAPKTVWTLPIWEKAPFKLITVGADDRWATPSYLRSDLGPGNTYGAPDPRTGK